MDRQARIVAGEGKDMTDREMLELAAKAAGMRVIWPNEAVLPDGRSIRWNPLTDDGDALRLAVKLKLAFATWGSGACVVVFLHGGRGRIVEPHYGDDPERATRRAIVRAAAEIGRNMTLPEKTSSVSWTN
jgi:hypothetical protein